jgi:hypothetical protein
VERRRELLRTEVFAIVKNMLAGGERPIQARVQKMLSADSLRAWKTLGRFLNEATGNLMIPKQNTFAELAVVFWGEVIGFVENSSGASQKKAGA